jgi:hypothetical protein
MASNAPGDRTDYLLELLPSKSALIFLFLECKQELYKLVNDDSTTVFLGYIG